MKLKRPLIAIVLAALTSPSPQLIAQGGRDATDTTLEHTLSFVVDLPKKKPKENEELYATRRQKIIDELTTRLLYRYKVAGVHNPRASFTRSKSTAEVRLFSKRSPSFLQAIALGRGELSVRKELDQSELWEDLLLDAAAAKALLPRAVKVREDARGEVHVESDDATALYTFLQTITTPDGSSLHLVRADEPGMWRSIWLGTRALERSSDAIERVSLHQSAQTGSTYGKIEFTAEGEQQWKKLKQDAARPLVLTLDGEPITTLHRPSFESAPSEVLASTTRVAATGSLTFACEPTWTGSAKLEECVTLVVARASAPIPLKVVPAP